MAKGAISSKASEGDPIIPKAATGNSQASVAIAEQITRAAFETAKVGGFDILTSRSVATAAGVSPSAIMYHFGGIHEVKRRVAVTTHQAMGAWRDHIESSSEGGLAVATPAGVTVGALLDLMLRQRGLGLLHAELLGANEFEVYARLERGSGEWWTSLFEKLGCSRGHAISWADLFYGLAPLVLLDSSPTGAASWLPLLVQRFSDRVAGRPSFPDELFPFPERQPSPPAPTAQGAQRILNATLELIADIGVDNLTHRLVSAKAGLSLASTTYFFESKTDLIIGAVHEMHRRGIKRVHEHLDSSTSGSVLDAQGNQLSLDMRACYAMHAPAARRTELHAVRPLLRDMRGPMAMLRLQREGVDADRLDSVVWTTLMFGAIHPLRMPQRNVAAELEARSALHRANLFHK